MNAKSKYSLQRTMVVYFLLIGFAVLFVGFEFIAETHGTIVRQAFRDRVADHDAPMGQKDVLQSLNHIRNKAVLTIAIILVVILIVMTMFMKHITEPLQHLITAARSISVGDLRQTIRIQEHNELAELGGIINEMSGNLQEIIHISRNTCATGKAFLGALDRPRPQSDPANGVPVEIQQELNHFRSELEMLAALLDCFKCYGHPEAKP